MIELTPALLRYLLTVKLNYLQGPKHFYFFCVFYKPQFTQGSFKEMGFRDMNCLLNLKQCYLRYITNFCVTMRFLQYFKNIKPDGCYAPSH